MQETEPAWRVPWAEDSMQGAGGQGQVCVRDSKPWCVEGQACGQERPRGQETLSVWLLTGWATVRSGDSGLELGHTETKTCREVLDECGALNSQNSGTWQRLEPPGTSQSEGQSLWGMGQLAQLLLVVAGGGSRRQPGHAGPRCL